MLSLLDIKYYILMSHFNCLPWSGQKDISDKKHARYVVPLFPLGHPTCSPSAAAGGPKETETNPAATAQSYL